VVGAYLLWRYGRRKWRAFHAHGAVVGAVALWEATARRRRAGDGSVPSDGELASWSPRVLRRELWHSVDQASAAVRAATGVGAPTAELPALCRRLHAAAVDLDKILRVTPAAPVPADVAGQAGDIMRAAADVGAAAVASASDANGERVRRLTDDAGHEIALLDAGLASARSALTPPPR
jgi:hypothetical protein